MPTTETHNISIHIKKTASLFVTMKVGKSDVYLRFMDEVFL